MGAKGEKAKVAAKTGKSKPSKSPVAKVSARVPEVKPLTAAQKIGAYGIDLICERTSECVAQRKIAAEIGVSWATFVSWINAEPARVEQYTRAREAQADKFAEDIVDIADEVVLETRYDGEDVKLVMDSTAVARNRLRVDARKWLASKMAPKKYGDKTTQEITGIDGGPVDVSLKVSFVSPG